MAYQNIVERILDVLKANFGDYFKAYYDGDPILIGQSSLPAIAIDMEEEKYDLGPTGFDNNGQQVVIKLIMNKKDDFGADDKTDQTGKKLRILAAGRSANGLLLPESVVGALRTDFTLAETLLDQEISIKYGVMPRPEDVITAEAHITIVTRELQEVPNRA